MNVELSSNIDPTLVGDLVSARLGEGSHEDRMKAYRKLPQGEVGDIALSFADQPAKAIAERQEQRGSNVAP